MHLFLRHTLRSSVLRPFKPWCVQCQGKSKASKTQGRTRGRNRAEGKQGEGQTRAEKALTKEVNASAEETQSSEGSNPDGG